MLNILHLTIFGSDVRSIIMRFLFTLSLFFSCSIFAASACERENPYHIEIQVRQALQSDSLNKQPCSFQKFHILQKDALSTKGRQLIKQLGYFELPQAEQDTLKENYIKGHSFLEWRYKNLNIMQFCNSNDGRHTLSITDPDKGITYYKQQRFDKQGSLADTYCDSKYQVEYWEEEGKWVVDTVDFRIETYPDYDSALKKVKESGSTEKPYHEQPYTFAHPLFQKLISEQEGAEIHSPNTKLLSFFYSYLTLSSVFMPPLSKALVSNNALEEVEESLSHSDTPSWSSFFSSSLLEYLLPASLLALKPTENHLFDRIKSTLGFGILSFLVSPYKASAQLSLSRIRHEIVEATCTRITIKLRASDSQVIRGRIKYNHNCDWNKSCPDLQETIANGIYTYTIKVTDNNIRDRFEAEAKIGSQQVGYLDEPIWKMLPERGRDTCKPLSEIRFIENYVYDSGNPQPIEVYTQGYPRGLFDTWHRLKVTLGKNNIRITDNELQQRKIISFSDNPQREYQEWSVQLPPLEDINSSLLELCGQNENGQEFCAQTNISCVLHLKKGENSEYLTGCEIKAKYYTVLHVLSTGKGITYIWGNKFFDGGNNINYFQHVPLTPEEILYHLPKQRASKKIHYYYYVIGVDRSSLQETEKSQIIRAALNQQIFAPYYRTTYELNGNYHDEL